MRRYCLASGITSTLAAPGPEVLRVVAEESEGAGAVERRSKWARDRRVNVGQVGQVRRVVSELNRRYRTRVSQPCRSIILSFIWS